ncbi:MAG: uracil-DNA glycosylase, partial [Cyclobacteriaceae bacterium]
MQSIRVGGVPEHFNYPWHLAMEKGKFRGAGLDISWQSYPGGTGAMTKALREGTCDVCMVLTEGAIADIIQGNPSRIISGYVKTPLIWGIHTSPKNNIEPDDIFSRNIAISRRGSGSHLMPVVHALGEGKSIQNKQFVLVNDLQGAISSISSLESDIFYWEKYTTKPYV